MQFLDILWHWPVFLFYQPFLGWQKFHQLIRCDPERSHWPEKRFFGLIFKLKDLSQLNISSVLSNMHHQNTRGHEVSLDNFSIVGREDNSIARNIKEAIFIRINDPSLNRNVGKFQLPYIWDEVLARSPELHGKKCQ